MLRKTAGEWLEIGYPVEQIIDYGNGTFQIIRGNKFKGKYNEQERSRGQITKMSKNSLARLVVVSQSTDIIFTSMLTLTYPSRYPKDGSIVKADVNFLASWFKSQFKFSYLWFLEFQSRGAPHVHILLDNDGISPRLRAKAGLKWTERIATAEWFYDGHDYTDDEKQRVARIIRNMAAVNCHPKTWEMLREGDGARRYVTKYATKQLQKEVPGRFENVGRFWGCSKDVPKEGITLDVTDDEVRDFLASRGHRAADWEVLPKYIFNVNEAEYETSKNGQKV